MRRYDAQGMEELLGPEFELHESVEHLYRRPDGGERPYVYGRFRRR